MVEPIQKYTAQTVQAVKDRVREVQAVKDRVREVQAVKDRVREVQAVKDRVREVQAVKDRVREVKKTTLRSGLPCTKMTVSSVLTPRPVIRRI
jgi:hypothetical protein